MAKKKFKFFLCHGFVEKYELISVLFRFSYLHRHKRYPSVDVFHNHMLKDHYD